MITYTRDETANARQDLEQGNEHEGITSRKGNGHKAGITNAMQFMTPWLKEYRFRWIIPAAPTSSSPEC